LIDGVLLDGTAFDWQDYHGKDVLICFWTTWNENWPQDVDQIRQAVRDYRAGGLEVVTINLDDDRNTLERFLQTHPLPWLVLVDPDPMAAGFENVNAKRCGVEAVPFTLLVNREGVVTDLHLLGSRLRTVLEQRLGGD
jgi:peroxiredoxin